MSLTVEEIEQAREFVRLLARYSRDEGREWLAAFEADCDLVLAAARAAADGAG